MLLWPFRGNTRRDSTPRRVLHSTLGVLRHHALREITTGLADMPGPFFVCGDRPGEEHHSRKNFVVYLLVMVIEMLSDVVDGAGDNTHRLGA